MVALDYAQPRFTRRQVVLSLLDAIIGVFVLGLVVIMAMSVLWLLG